MGGRDPIAATRGGPRRRSVLVVALVVLLGMIGTGLASFALHQESQRWGDQAFEQKQDVITQLVAAELFQYAFTIADLAASVGAQSELTAGDFAALTAQLNGLRLPGAVAVSYIVPATTATTPALQARWRALGNRRLTLSHGATARDEFFYPVLGRELDGRPPELGRDLQDTPAIVDALRTSRSAGGITFSEPYLPAGSTEQSFVIVSAVTSTAPASQAGQFEGWVTMTYHGRNFLGPGLGIIGGEQVAIAFADITGPEPITLATWEPDVAVDTSMPPRLIPIPILQHRWRLTVRPTLQLLPTAEAWLARGAAGIGTLITLLLAALTASVVTSRDRALRRVDQATAELRDDITRREAVEEQLRTREAELVGFAGVVAHDLRSPLTSVIGYSELMATMEDDPLSAAQRGRLSRVQNSAVRMRTLIDDLLAYATADNTTLKLTEIDLNALVDDIVAERLGDGTPEQTIISYADLLTVCGDPGQIRQVLDNLIGNAVKYTPPGRPAEVTVSATRPDPATCRVEVADRGIGIPEEQRGEVFNAFMRAGGSEGYQGTGLGLAIVWRIVERHGGRVGVEANPGGGTRFWFTLPAR
ncbi:sensor histidine kinase [Actinoplanes awajinensis]|uniref:sensor histidine kinase n=1 Tax=Actinoplanes awajinensis TaxID=135946 RepID=UPI0018DE1F10|nr:ATP-binding protein [Actinoplanes awajinensis]